MIMKVFILFFPLVYPFSNIVNDIFSSFSCFAINQDCIVQYFASLFHLYQRDETFLQQS